MKTFKFLLVLHNHENTDDFITLNDNMFCLVTLVMMSEMRTSM